MMSVSNTCFNCNAKIEKDAYGLTQCPSCQTLIFVDFEGRVQKPPQDEVDRQEVSDDLNKLVAEESQSVKEQESSNLSSISFDQNLQVEAHVEDQSQITGQPKALEDSPHESSSFQEALNPMDEQKSQTDFEMPQDNPFTDISSQEISDASEESHFEDLESKDDIYKNENTNEDHQQTGINSQPLQDVVDYANTPDNLDLGGFYYNVIISGIDSKNLRQSVLEALDDNRLGWQKEEIASLIKEGCLTIEKLNAAKTYILISYLKFLPVKVKWDQISLTKS